MSAAPESAPRAPHAVWLLGVTLLVAGCTPPADASPIQRRDIGRVVAFPFGEYGYTLYAVDDTVRGVTCYTLRYDVLSCVKVKP